MSALAATALPVVLLAAVVVMAILLNRRASSRAERTTAAIVWGVAVILGLAVIWLFVNALA